MIPDPSTIGCCWASRAFSELELAMFRRRSQEALRLKAARGELNTAVAIGYRRGAGGRLEKHPGQADP